MKKTLIVLFALAMTLSLSAQVRTGTIYGKVVDNEKNPLPGVTMTLTASILAPLTTITNDQGIFRFPGLSPLTGYALKAELQGFKTATKTGIIVSIGNNTEINLTMEIGKLEEQITVVAITPVVDSKKTATATNLNNEELQSLPTARDPWVVMQLTPSIMMDRENVGGNESGQQSGFLARGDTGNNFYYGANNIWAVDGIDITDPAALGGSALYYDFDMFEELNITTGGADVTVQTGGIALNMVTRRGGNKTSLAGRFYLTDNYFQASNLTASLKAQGVNDTNKIQYIKDYGVNVGGPLIKDKVWWWGAYGVQDIYDWTITETKNQIVLNNYNFKLNAQPFTGNRFEAMITSGAKENFGRNAGTVATPQGYHQIGMYHWGSPVVKLQDEQTIGDNLFVSLKYSFNDAGFQWTPVPDPDLIYPVVYDVANKTYADKLGYGGVSYDWYYVARPRNNAQAALSYFNDGLLGMSHEFKAGFEFSHKDQDGNGNDWQDFYIYTNYNTPQIDITGDQVKDIPTGWNRFYVAREPHNIYDVRQYAGYLQDTVTSGRFNVVLGVRYDNQIPYAEAFTIQALKVGTTAANTAIDASAQTALLNFMPALSVNSIHPDYQWKTWSPRIGVTWDIFGTGKTIAKVSVAQYGDIMGVGQGTSLPLGTGGSMNFWWKDANGDKKVELNELYWAYSSLMTGHKYQLYPAFDASGNFVGNLSDGRQAGMYSGWDPTNPTYLNYNSATTYFTDASKASTRTRELLVTLEHEFFTDFAASINLSLRKYDKFDWYQTYWPNDTGNLAAGGVVMDPSKQWYYQAGVVPSTIGGYSTGGASGRPWYVVIPSYTSSDYTYCVKSTEYTTYWGMDFILNKRLSNKWFLNASLTLQNQYDHWNGAFLDPTNQWAFDGQPFVQALGAASGKINVNAYTRWMAKISALYQLPWDVSISGTFNAREGWRIPHYFTIEDDSLPGLGVSNTIYTQANVTDALPTFYDISLRLEKMIKLGDNGRVYFMADVFNALNSAIINRAYDAYYGDYFTQSNTWVPNVTNRKLNEILNPRVTRFGVRFQF